MTFSCTPLVASTSCEKLEVKKLTPRRRLPVSTPIATAPAATGNIEPKPASVRNCRADAHAAAAVELQNRPATALGDGGHLAFGVGRPWIADQVHQGDVLVTVGVEVAVFEVDVVLGRKLLYRGGFARPPQDRLQRRRR